MDPALESVSDWISQLKAGNDVAAQKLWDRYFGRLVGLARKKLHDFRRASADEEDVALSAFDSFCRAAQLGNFPELHDRGNLWPLLVLITARKACALRRREGAQRRGKRLAEGAREADLANVIGPEPTPDFVVQVAEECQRLLQSLDPDLRAIASAKMEGCTNEEIAERLGCVTRTVERRLQVIRSLWAEEFKS